MMKGKKVNGLYRLEGSFVRGGTVGSVESLVQGGKIGNLSSYWHSREMSNCECGGTESASKRVKFQEQQTLQQSLKGGRPIRIPTQVCGGDMLAHAYSIEESPTSEFSEKVEKQTWCFKSDASSDGTVSDEELVKKNVARGELCKPLKIAPIRFGNFGEDLDCMQAAALCMFEGKSYCPRVKFGCLSNLTNSSCC